MVIEGAHSNGRVAGGVVEGDAVEAATNRRRAQDGMAALGRKGKAVKAAKKSKARASTVQEEAEDAIRSEVQRAMTAGANLVQASLEHLEEGERMWDEWAARCGVRIAGFPTEEQVVTFMATASRERQRGAPEWFGRRGVGAFSRLEETELTAGRPLPKTKDCRRFTFFSAALKQKHNATPPRTARNTTVLLQVTPRPPGPITRDVTRLSHHSRMRMYTTPSKRVSSRRFSRLSSERVC